MDLPNLVTPGTRAVLLVEGLSDHAAVETIAARMGMNLANDGVLVVAMGGATNIGHYLSQLASEPTVLIAGLYDAAEERHVLRGLDRVGLGPTDSASDLATAGFFACVRDLEDEFIRALGTNAVLELMSAEGELESFRILQNQPAHRDGSVHSQLRRFLGTKAHRKIRYGRLLAEAVAADEIPQPLVRLLEYVRLPSSSRRAGKSPANEVHMIDDRAAGDHDQPMGSSLYDAIGGYDKLLALAHAWHERCLADPIAAHPFSYPDQHPQHLERLATYWGEALGGPAEYSASMGTETDVWRMHAGNEEHHELNERCIALFEQAIEDVDLPPDTRGPLAGYFRWATERMMGTPMEPDDVADDVPLPHWSWGGLQ